MIRLYQGDDFDFVTKSWYEAQRVAMPELAARNVYGFEYACEYFRNVIVAENQVWIYELNGIPVAFLGIHDEFIDRLYVDPKFHHMGIGKALLDKARALSPEHLWLYTHMANRMARAFYDKNGFIAERFGISPAPELEPDVEYHWRNS